MNAKPLLGELFFFGVAGTIGFAVDVAVLYLLKGSLGVYWARLISFIVASITTWFLNRHLSFKHKTSNKSALRELVHYFWMVSLGGMVNYGIYAASLSLISAVAAMPAIGVALGSLSGMLVNFLQLKFLMYRHNK